MDKKDFRKVNIFLDNNNNFTVTKVVETHCCSDKRYEYYLFRDFFGFENPLIISNGTFIEILKRIKLELKGVYSFQGKDDLWMDLMMFDGEIR